MDFAHIRSFDRGIENLLDDGKFSAFAATRRNGFQDGASSARTCIIICNSYIEACANACLDALGMPDMLSKEIERIRTLQKFEAYSFFAHKGAIDYSRPEVRRVIELIGVRNSYLHPKRIKLDWKPTGDITAVGQSPQTPILGINRISSYCCAQDAKSALLATHQFMSYFFLEVCKITSSQVNSLIFSRLDIPDINAKHAPPGPSTFSWIEDWLSAEGIKIDYINYGLHF